MSESKLIELGYSDVSLPSDRFERTGQRIGFASH